MAVTCVVLVLQYDDEPTALILWHPTWPLDQQSQRLPHLFLPNGLPSPLRTPSKLVQPDQIASKQGKFSPAVWYSLQATTRSTVSALVSHRTPSRLAPSHVLTALLRSYQVTPLSLCTRSSNSTRGTFASSASL